MSSNLPVNQFQVRWHLLLLQVELFPDMIYHQTIIKPYLGFDVLAKMTFLIVIYLKVVGPGHTGSPAKGGGRSSHSAPMQAQERFCLVLPTGVKEPSFFWGSNCCPASSFLSLGEAHGQGFSPSLRVRMEPQVSASWVWQLQFVCAELAPPFFQLFRVLISKMQRVILSHLSCNTLLLNLQ